MKKMAVFQISIPALIVGFAISILFAGCDLISPAGDPQFKVVWVGLHGVQQSPPTSMYQVDEIAIYNQGNCTSDNPDEANKLVWDGNNFSVSYQLTCQGESETSVRIVTLSGRLSANQKTLETFTGSMKDTFTSDDLTDYREFFLAVKDVPLEGDEELLSGMLEEDLTGHVVNAYWVWNTTENGETTNRQSNGISYDNPRMDLLVSFYGAW